MSKYKFRFVKEAEQEYDAAALYYAENGGIDVAERFIIKVDTVIEMLEMYPNAGDNLKEIPGVKSARVPKYPYRIFYTVNKDGLEVIGISVYHSKRDLDNLIPGLEKRFSP